VVVKSVLHLGGVDQLTAGENHVLLPVDNIEVAFAIYGGEVAGVKPPVAKGLGGGIG
jgi:hypothetical protein